MKRKAREGMSYARRKQLEHEEGCWERTKEENIKLNARQQLVSDRLSFRKVPVYRAPFTPPQLGSSYSSNASFDNTISRQHNQIANID